MIISHHPIKNISLTFYPDSHKYIDSNNIEYVSVSGWVTNFFEEFDSENIATRCAKKRGVTKQSLLDEWKRSGDEAAHQGNIVHGMIHDIFKGNMSPYFCDSVIMDSDTYDIVYKYRSSIYDIHNKLTNILDVVFLEKIIFDPISLIAGTFDALFITKDKSKYILIDWKSSKVIETTTKYNKWGKYPYRHLPDCNHSHFSLQMAEYERILKTQGYLEYDIPIIKKIVHITPIGGKSYDCIIKRT